MRIVIADGYTTVRLGLKGLLLATDIQVVGETENGEETIRLAQEMRPDLVILGLNLTGQVGGIGACRKIKALPNPPRILVYAAQAFSERLSWNLWAEADGCIHKRACHRELLDTIRRTAASERLGLPNGANGKPYFRSHVVAEETSLTQKEREVLALMLCHYGNDEIAQELHLGLPTVKTHVKNTLRKMGAKNRKELLRRHVRETFTTL